MSVETTSIPSAFIWRRVHSLTGFWLVLYLILHLITNSQAALWIGEDGSGFVKLVNSLETMPYLQVVETVLIAIPLAVHMIWGIKRAIIAKTNSGKTDGGSPSLRYERNRAFTWQRLTSWILLIGIIGHVAQMRFLDAPKKVKSVAGEQYLTRLSFDEGLYTLAARLHVCLFSRADVEKIKQALRALPPVSPRSILSDASYDSAVQSASVSQQKTEQEREWMEAVSSFQLQEGDVLAASSVPGTAFLLMVRNTFKSPLMAVLYTIFLLAAAFHAFNGFWTFLITWGMILSYRSQKAMIPISVGGIIVLSALGIAAIWGTYWVNLRY